MGQVGGNGSVVWQNQHQPKDGKFKCKERDKEKLKKDQLGLGNALEVWGRDEITIGEIGTTRVPDLEPGLIQRPGHFLVRLRFDGLAATEIEAWFHATTSTPASVKMFRNGDTVVLAVLVKAIERPHPGDGVSYENMPWEIRYDW